MTRTILSSLRARLPLIAVVLVVAALATSCHGVVHFGHPHHVDVFVPCR